MTSRPLQCTTGQRICFVVDCDLCTASLEIGDRAAHFTTPLAGTIQAIADGWHRLPDGRLVCTRTNPEHAAARRIVLPDDAETREYVRLLNRRASLLTATHAIAEDEPRPDAIYAELDRILPRLLAIRSRRPDLHDVQPDLPRGVK